MSTAEQHYRLSARNATAGDAGSAQRPFYESEEDNVAWPPVIARIRDLDRAVTAVNPAPCPILAVETLPSINSSVAKPTISRRLSQRISSRLIAIVGIAIFIAAVLPYMYLRDRKPSTEATAVWPNSSPVAPAAPSGNPTTAAVPAEKKPTPPATSPQAAVTGDVKPATGPAAPAAPPLLALPEKTTPPRTVAAVPPAKAPVAPPANVPALPPTVAPNIPTGVPNNPVVNKPVVTRPDVASQPLNLRAGAVPVGQVGSETKQVAEIVGDFVPMPGAMSPKVEPAKTVVPTQLAPTAAPSPIVNGIAMPQTMPLQPAIIGQPALPTPPTNPNAPMLSGPAVPAGMAPNVPQPAMAGPSIDPRYPYPREADVRNDVRSRYDATPDYRRPAVNNQTAPNGQPLPNGQQPPADWRKTPAGAQLPPTNVQYQGSQYPGGQYPPSSVRPGTAPPQRPAQVNPYPPAASPYPSNQAIPQNPNTGAAPGAWQSGGYPPPAYNNAPSAAPPAAYPINRDGYSTAPAVPPATDIPPARY